MYSNSSYPFGILPSNNFFKKTIPCTSSNTIFPCISNTEMKNKNLNKRKSCKTCPHEDDTNCSSETKPIFRVNPDNYKYYLDGSHRRPGDPLSGEECEKALQFLFESPSSVEKINIKIQENVKNSKNGFLDTYQSDSFFFTKDEFEALRQNRNSSKVRIRIGCCQLEPPEDPSIFFNVDNAIYLENKIPEFERHISFEIDNPKPIDSKMLPGELFSTTYIIILDVTIPEDCFLVDVRMKKGGGLLGISQSFPPPIELTEQDKNLMLYLTEALIQDDVIKKKGSILEISNGNTVEEGQVLRSFTPFRYLNDETLYGYNNDSDYADIFYVSCNSMRGEGDKLNYSQRHVAHNNIPVTCIATLQHTKHPTYSENIHPNSETNILCFNLFDRALLMKQSDFYGKDGEFKSKEEIRKNYFTAVKKAWKKDDFLSDGKTSPLHLFDNSGFLKIKFIEGISYIQDDFIEEAVGQSNMKDNYVDYKPPIINDRLQFQQAKSPIIQNSKDGSEIKVDGYNICWKNWSFNIGFDIVRGVELNTVQYKFPKTQSNQSPQYTPYAYQVFIPHLMTIYTASDGISAQNFDDTLFFGTGKYIQDTVHGMDCIGDMINLPVYKCWNQTNADGNKRIGVSNTWKTDTRGNFFPRDNLSIPITDATTQNPEYAFDNIRGYAFGICIQEKDSGVILKHHTSIKRGKELHVNSYYSMNFYTYQFTYIFHEDGIFDVRIGASGTPLTYVPFNNVVGNNSKNYFSTCGNHKHCFIVGVEPVPRGITQKVEKIKITDTGEIGVEIKKHVNQINNIDDVLEFGKFNWEDSTKFSVSSFDNNGNNLGSLIFDSGSFSYIIDVKPKKMKVSYTDAYYPFTNTLWTLPYSSDSTTKYLVGRGELFNRRLNDFTTYDNFPKTGKESLYKNNDLVRMFLTLALDHEVIQEDTPIQRMMYKTLKISPANLFPYNPLILMDHQSNNEFKKDRGFKI